MLSFVLKAESDESFLPDHTFQSLLIFVRVQKRIPLSSLSDVVFKVCFAFKNPTPFDFVSFSEKFFLKETLKEVRRRNDDKHPRKKAMNGNKAPKNFRSPYLFGKSKKRTLILPVFFFSSKSRKIFSLSKNPRIPIDIQRIFSYALTFSLFPTKIKT